MPETSESLSLGNYRVEKLIGNKIYHSKMVGNTKKGRLKFQRDEPDYILNFSLPN